MGVVAAYLLDIEGTTTPVDFVTKTLFPFARRELSSFVASHEVGEELRLLGEEYDRDLADGKAPPAWPGKPTQSGVVPYLEWLMDHDRKSTGLKSIQGKIWEDGYASGNLKGIVYPDVDPAFRRWKDAGKKIAMFSSGSVLAQKLIFGHLEVPLSPFIDAYFDTGVGPKRVASSYETIASQLGIPAAEILFLSDIAEEVSAALVAGMQSLQVLRDGQRQSQLAFVRDFNELA
jgi:enolase-phosphatase E1